MNGSRDQSGGDGSGEQWHEKISSREVVGRENFVVGLVTFCCLTALLRYNLNIIHLFKAHTLMVSSILIQSYANITTV